MGLLYPKGARCAYPRKAQTSTTTTALDGRTLELLKTAVVLQNPRAARSPYPKLSRARKILLEVCVGAIQFGGGVLGTQRPLSRWNSSFM